MQADITAGDGSAAWLVIGWFTADYAHLAHRLAADLDSVGAPYHFYAKELAPGGWLANTLRKPEVLLQAYEQHPGKTLILFDVDMQVCGNISAMAEAHGDVIVHCRTKRGDAFPWRRRRRRLHFGSRSMVWKCNEAAKRLAHEWLRQCKMPGIKYGDEIAFIEAYATSVGVAVARMDSRFAGCEKGRAPDGAVVLHESEHDKKTKWFLRSFIRRPFRLQ